MAGPVVVAAVELDGIRYEALHWGKERGLGQNGGFIVAINVASGEELWVKRIYKIKYGTKSPQKYDRFITGIELDPSRRALLITDETGSVHRLTLTSRRVKRVRGPDPFDDGEDDDAPPRRKPTLWERLFGG